MTAIQFGSHYKLNIHPTRFQGPAIGDEERQRIAQQVLDQLKSKAPGSWGKVNTNGTELDFVCLDQYDSSSSQQRADGFKVNNAFIFPDSKNDPRSIPDQAAFDAAVASLQCPQ